MSAASLETVLAFILRSIWRASWQASILAALVLVIQMLFARKLSGRGRYLLWSIVLLRLLLPTMPQSRFSVFNLSFKNEPAETANFKSEIPNSALAAAPSFIPEGPSPTRLSPPETEAPQEGVKIAVLLPRILLIGWLLGMAALSIRVMRECLRGSRLVRELQETTDAQVKSIVDSCASSLGLRRLPRVLAGDVIQTPAVMGIWRPVLLLPSQVLARCTREQVAMIVMHELAHLKRRDIAANWLVTLVTVIHWFNPIVWLMAARIRADRELACDELVLSRAGNSGCNVQTYGNTLLALVELLSPSPAQRQLVGILESSAPLERRIRMIARFDPKASGRWAWSAMILMVLAVAFLTDAVSGQGRRSGNPVAAAPATRPAQAAGEQTTPSSDDEVHKVLDRVLPEVRFDNVAFSDVIDFMRDVTSANIVVEWRALEEAGIDRGTLVSMKLRNISVGQAFDHILRDVGGPLDYAVKSGAIVVMINRGSEPPRRRIPIETVFYDVTDLLTLTGQANDAAMKSLCSAVEGTLESQQGLSLEGMQMPMTRGYGTKLIVTTSADGHQVVRRILANLRDKPATQPHADSR